MDYRPGQGKPKRKTKPPRPKGKSVQPVNLDKERAYFQEVDSFELLEESPSPKNFGTWTVGMGAKSDDITIPHLSSVLEKWLISKRLNFSCGPSGSLSKILETPSMPMEPICSKGLDLSKLKTPEKFSAQSQSDSLIMSDEVHEDLEASIRKLSLASSCRDPLLALLAYCGQSTPSTFSDVLSKYCEPESIIKVGEGTFGEAFKTGKTVCKIVPIDGDLPVNGEAQKVAICELPFHPISSEVVGGVGGTCVIRGCVPKKILVYGASFGGELEDARNYGWELNENVDFNWKKLLHKKLPQNKCILVAILGRYSAREEII